MKRRAKIVCTLGPASGSREKIKDLIEAGMNVARINCSHGDWATRSEWIRHIRELSPEIGPVGVLVDIQGPKFRIGEFPGGSIALIPGQSVTVGPSQSATIAITQPEILATFAPGTRLLLGDGDVELKLGAASGADFEAKAVSGGLVKSRQGVTVVGKVFESPCLTPKDVIDVQEAARCGADFIALSYVHNALDMRELRRMVDRLGSKALLCAKIETRAAVKNLDEILRASDAVMVARGDMGLQMEPEEVPVAQKRIIEKANFAGKPVITATQMLESMIQNPRPTRAEATDVANAILDGTDAVMLSGETASGAYPVECVRTMSRIIEKAEPIFDRSRLESRFEEASAGERSSTEAVAFAATQLAKMTKPAAIVTTTTSGQTSRLVSRFRPRCQILCATWSETAWRQMSLVWGVEAIHVSKPTDTDHNLQSAIDGFLKVGRVKLGDEVVITAGAPAGVPGNTNLIQTERVK